MKLNNIVGDAIAFTKGAVLLGIPTSYAWNAASDYIGYDFTSTDAVACTVLTGAASVLTNYFALKE